MLPIGRIIAQVAVMASGVVVRAFAEAFAQAAQGGKAGAQQAAARAAAAQKSKGVMSLEQAQQILGVQLGSTKPEEIGKTFATMFKNNDVKKGGSFYLQSKIFRAHEMIEMKLQEEGQTTGVELDLILEDVEDKKDEKKEAA